MANKAVNSDAVFARCAHYNSAGYGWRYSAIEIQQDSGRQ